MSLSCLCFYPPSFSSPSCTPLFMFGSRPLFFCLNNWMEARPVEGGKCVWLDKKRTRKLGDILLSDLAFSRWRWWLNNLFLTSLLTDFSPGKVDLPPSSASPSFFHIILVHFLLSLRTFFFFFLMWIDPDLQKQQTSNFSINNQWLYLSLHSGVWSIIWMSRLVWMWCTNDGKTAIFPLLLLRCGIPRSRRAGIQIDSIERSLIVPLRPARKLKLMMDWGREWETHGEHQTGRGGDGGEKRGGENMESEE